MTVFAGMSNSWEASPLQTTTEFQKRAHNILEKTYSESYLQISCMFLFVSLEIAFMFSAWP